MTLTSTAVPVDNLVRALFGPEAAELRAQVDDDGDGGTLYGHFAVFNQWTEINSAWEGQFMERIAPGAFADTMKARKSQIKVLYDHGQDPQLGNKPLGAIRSMGEDTTGAFYEVDLLRDASGALVPYISGFLAPAAKAGLLGSSFRFKVTAESWVDPEKSSAYNPAMLSERTIERLDLYEFGPVTFPAYEAATAAVRCGTDKFFHSVLSDPAFVARMTDRLGADIVEKMIAGMAPPTFVGEQGPELLARVADSPPEAQQATDDTADGLQTWNPETHRIEQHRQSTAAFDAHLSRQQETR